MKPLKRPLRSTPIRCKPVPRPFPPVRRNAPSLRPPRNEIAIPRPARRLTTKRDKAAKQRRTTSQHENPQLHPLLSAQSFSIVTPPPPGGLLSFSRLSYHLQEDDGSRSAPVSTALIDHSFPAGDCVLGNSSTPPDDCTVDPGIIRVLHCVFTVRETTSRSQSLLKHCLRSPSRSGSSATSS